MTEDKQLCDQLTKQTARAASQSAGVRVKPMDMPKVLMHAFLSGFVAAREIPSHEECDGKVAWADYEPYEPGPYSRILSALFPATDLPPRDEALARREALAEAAEAVRKNCPECRGTGQRDTGGVYPWGESIFVACDCDDAIRAMIEKEPT